MSGDRQCPDCCGVVVGLTAVDVELFFVDSHPANEKPVWWSPGQWEGRTVTVRSWQVSTNNTPLPPVSRLVRHLVYHPLTLSYTVNPQTGQNSSSLNPCFLKSFGMKLLLILRNYPVLVQHYLLIFNWKECSLDTEIKRTIPTIKYLRNDKWSLKS